MKWSIHPLSKIATDLQPGFAMLPKAGDSSFPQLRTNNVSPEGRIDLTLVKEVPASKKECERYSLQHGDILFNNTNSVDLVGKTALFDLEEPYLFSNHMTRVRVNPEVADPHFVARQLFWIWKSGGFRTMVTRWVNQAAINKTMLGGVDIFLPALSEQRRIVEILHQADALRRKRAEADAKAGRILPALFYRTFGDPLALISSGKGVPLSELEVNLQNGFACGEKDVEDGVPHLRMNNIDDAGVLNLELVRTVPLDRDTERYRIMRRDVLFMGTNSEDKIGKTCVFLPPDERTYLFSNHLIRLRASDSRITPEYLAGFLHLLWSKRFFPSIAKRWVNQASVAQSSLAALRIPLPDEKMLKVFTTAFQNLLSLRAQRVRSGLTLDQTFSVLLHRAFTGDLTAKWREAHMKELLAEMEIQEKSLETTNHTKNTKEKNQ